jgi:hypothetical protein
MSESDRTAAILQPINLRADSIYLWTQEQYVQAAGRIPAETLRIASAGLGFLRDLQDAFNYRFPTPPTMAVEVPEALRRLVATEWSRARREVFA